MLLQTYHSSKTQSKIAKQEMRQMQADQTTLCQKYVQVSFAIQSNLHNTRLDNTRVLIARENFLAPLTRNPLKLTSIAREP
jgi:hypothetical protein